MFLKHPDIPNLKHEKVLVGSASFLRAGCSYRVYCKMGIVKPEFCGSRDGLFQDEFCIAGTQLQYDRYL